MANNKYLIDTSALLSMLYKRDASHKQAQKISQSLNKDRQKVAVITDYILDETLTLIKDRVGHREAVKFGKLVFSAQTKLKLVYLSNKLIRKAFELFVRYSDKGFSFTDCASFAVMQHYKITQAFTFDKHFEQAGFEIIEKK